MSEWKPSEPLKEAMGKLGRILGYTGGYRKGRGQHYYGAFPDNIHEFGDLLAVYLQSQPSVNSLTQPPTGFDNLEIGKLYLWYSEHPKERRDNKDRIVTYGIDFDGDGWADYPVIIYSPYQINKEEIKGIYIKVYPERWDRTYYPNKTLQPSKTMRRKKYFRKKNGKNISLFINDTYRLSEEKYTENKNLFVEINPTPIFLNWHDDSPLFVEVAK